MKPPQYRLCRKCRRNDVGVGVHILCVSPDDVGNADAISNTRLTIMQSAEFFRILSAASKSA